MPFTDKYFDVYYGQGEREQGTDPGQLYVDTNTYNVYLTDAEKNMHQVGYTDIDIRIHDQYYETMKSLAEQGVLQNVQIVPYGQTRLVTSAVYSTDTVAENVSIIVLPSTITVIGANCCQGYSNLTSIKIPPRVTSIGDYAFARTSVKNIVIPDYVVELGSDVFSNCSELTSLYIGKRVESIQSNNDDAYLGKMPELTSLKVHPENKTYISKLSGTETNCLVHKDSATLLRGCSTSSIPSDAFVYSIADYAFEGCTKLKEINIPNSAEYMGFGVFKGCSGLQKITIPFIGETIYEHENENSHFGYIFGAEDYTDNRKCLPFSLVHVITSADRIFEHAFHGCEYITSINISNARTIGESAFEGCDELKYVIFSSLLVSIGKDAFKNCSELGDNGLEGFTAPDTLTTIGDNAFDGTSIGNIIINTSSTTVSVGSYAFANNTCLQSIQLGRVVMGSNVFGGCGITHVTLDLSSFSFSNLIVPSENVEEYYFGKLFFNSDECDDTKIVSPINRNCDSSLHNDNDEWYYVPSYTEGGFGKMTVVLNNVTELPAQLFSGCANIESIELNCCSNNTLEIGNFCFCNCLNLTELKFNCNSNGTFTIGTSAFLNTMNLKDINFDGFATTNIKEFDEDRINHISNRAFDRNINTLRHTSEYHGYEDNAIPALPARTFNLSNLNSHVPTVYSSSDAFGKSQHYGDNFSKSYIYVSKTFGFMGSYELELNSSSADVGSQSWGTRLAYSS